VDGWIKYKLALAKHDASESEKETAFLEKQRAKYSEWKERARAYRERIPATHQFQSSRVLEYIEERKRAVAEFETRLNTLGCYVLFRIRAQFKGEDRVLDHGFPPPAPAQPSRRPPVRVAASAAGSSCAGQGNVGRA
jgi:hypothetical protein